MKRFADILLSMLILTSCTNQPREEPQIEAVYDSMIYEIEPPPAMNYELAGNGKHTVLLPLFNGSITNFVG